MHTYNIHMAILTIIFVTICTTATFGQTIFERVSKDKTLSLNTTYIAQNDFEGMADIGYGATFNMGYKLSGYNNRRPVYLIVPLEYTIYPSRDDLVSINMLSYGWIIRHHMAKNRKWVPFFDYSLLLSQIREANVDGYIIGHQTRFGFGMNIGDERAGKWLSFVKVEYGYHNFPERGEKKTKHLHAISLRVGMRLLQKNEIDKSMSTY